MSTPPAAVNPVAPAAAAAAAPVKVGSYLESFIASTAYATEATEMAKFDLEWRQKIVKRVRLVGEAPPLAFLLNTALPHDPQTVYTKDIFTSDPKKDYITTKTAAVTRTDDGFTVLAWKLHVAAAAEAGERLFPYIPIPLNRLAFYHPKKPIMLAKIKAAGGTFTSLMATPGNAHGCFTTIDTTDEKTGETRRQLFPWDPRYVLSILGYKLSDGVALLSKQPPPPPPSSTPARPITVETAAVLPTPAAAEEGAVPPPPTKQPAKKGGKKQPPVAAVTEAKPKEPTKPKAPRTKKKPPPPDEKEEEAEEEKALPPPPPAKQRKKPTPAAAAGGARKKQQKKKPAKALVKVEEEEGEDGGGDELELEEEDGNQVEAAAEEAEEAAQPVVVSKKAKKGARRRHNPLAYIVQTADPMELDEEPPIDDAPPPPPLSWEEILAAAQRAKEPGLFHVIRVEPTTPLREPAREPTPLPRDIARGWAPNVAVPAQMPVDSTDVLLDPNVSIKDWPIVTKSDPSFGTIDRMLNMIEDATPTSVVKASPLTAEEQGILMHAHTIAEDPVKLAMITIRQILSKTPELSINMSSPHALAELTDVMLGTKASTTGAIDIMDACIKAMITSMALVSRSANTDAAAWSGPPSGATWDTTPDEDETHS